MKNLLLTFFDDDVADSAFSHAVMIAKRFNSHIVGIFIAPSPLILDGGAGMSGFATYSTLIEKESAALAERAKSRFKSVLSQYNIEMKTINGDSDTISADWCVFDKTISPHLGDKCRVFDMIIVGRGSGHQRTDWGTITESALFDSGRPVLVTPQKTERMGEHAAIAWNGSTETARTIALSMPILLKTKKVTVFTVSGWAVSGSSGEELVGNLLRHDINAALINIELGGRTPGQAIIEEAIGVGADLLVKGAYTQSRLRQFVFGGATRHILHEATLPVVMAH